MMRVQLLQFTIRTYSLIILLSIHGSYSLTNDGIRYSDTDEIFGYGVTVFSTIMKHHESNDSLINILRNIEVNIPGIHQLMIHNSSTILDMYSCRHESGLEYIDNTLKFFGEEYEAFENYLQNINDQHCKFPDNIVSIYESGIFDMYTQTSLQWKNPTDPMDNQELFGALVDRYDVMVKRNCWDFQSLNQYIHRLYNKILLELIRVYSIIVYSYTQIPLQKIIDNRTIDSKEVKKVIDHFEAHILVITDNAIKAMNEQSSRYISRDPPIHVKGVTYDSLDYFIQGYVADQRFFRQDEACTPSCSDYNDTVYYNHADGRFFPRKSICTGRIRSCTNSPVEKIHLASPNSTRRYDGLSNIPSDGKNLIYFGRKPEYYGLISITRYSGFCRICACTCDMVDSPKSIRYVDLRSHRSKSFAAFVITGTRFRIINRVLYLQIQEGVLKNGKIDPESVAWEKIGNTGRNHENDTQLFKLDYDHRSFDLSDLTLPDNYSATMISFTAMNGTIGLYIEGLNIIEAQLYKSPLKKVSNRSSEAVSSRPIFQPGGLKVPTSENINNSKISEPNRFQLKFETSDWESDVGQNVVPFIDLQNVVTHPPAPITGIGMHVRYGGASGGFLTPKLLLKNDAPEIVPLNIKKTIASLHSDVEAAVSRRLEAIGKLTSHPPVITSTSPPSQNGMTGTRDPLTGFFGSRG